MAELYRGPFIISSCLFLLLTRISIFAVGSLAADRITSGQSLKDGETLTSSRKSFELGFFSPSNSSLRHVGIWYPSISLQSVVWVANRNHPISNKNGSLTIGNNGNLLILDGNGSTIWASHASNVTENSTAILRDDGNFVLRNSDQSDSGSESNRFCWQSFEHPTDTYLPGMRLRVNGKAGVTKNFTSWKNESDPSDGTFSMGVDPQAAPQIVIWNGTNRLWRTGHWNGLTFLGVPSLDAFYYYGFKLSDPDPNGDMYLTYTPYNSSHIFQFLLTWNGKEEALRWESETAEWSILQYEPSTVCEQYNKCGNYGVCTVTNSPICDCMKGFEPSNPGQWNRGIWSGGCIRKIRLQCEGNSSLVSGDGFLKLEDVKLPDLADLLTVDEDQCADQCLNNCSCKAYAYVSGIGCLKWVQDLLDLQQFEEGGNTLYVRLASADLGGRNKLSHPIVAAIIAGGAVLLGTILWLFWILKAKRKVARRQRENIEIRITDIRRSGEYSTSSSGTDEIVGGEFAKAPDLPLLSYSSVAASTDYFSLANKLGQGGFGPVYKGKLPEGHEIAVKVLSRKSGQGMEEFKNEIELIAKLQHRNLVRLLGCCTESEEKMLIYEYMPNKSLDSFIFADAKKKAQLDWQKRVIIIEGVARGLLYLHRDSRVKIVHRDLKSSNILLDEDMNPKISDFGMARIFGGNQDHANTNRVVGTYGYMSPEYAMEGLFSEKSDVYSFGVLLLEIITGRRNSRFHSSDHTSLVEYAWKLWAEGKAVELIDPSIKSSCSETEVCRSVQIALLSLQDHAVDRPTISSVVLWLESDVATLPIPREPTYTSTRSSGNVNYHIEGTDTVSGNDVTITMVVGR